MIIDFHTHIFPDALAQRAVSALAANSANKPRTDGTEAGLHSSMRESGVSLSVNLPAITKPTQFESTLRFATEINSRFSGNPSSESSIISFAGIHPQDPLYEEHLWAAKECGIRGIKIHPDYQATFFDDEAYIRILSLAKKLDLITVTHAGIDGAFIGQPIKCTPERVLRVLDKLGGYPKLVLAHLAGMNAPEDVFEYIAGEDVYLDTAFVLPLTPKETLYKLIDRHGEDKILFATDSPWSGQKENLDYLSTLSILDTAKNKILCDNARALLAI